MRLRMGVIAAALGVAIAACGSPATVSPSAVAPAAPSIAPSIPAPSVTPTEPFVSPSATDATPLTPAPAASAAAACPVRRQTGLLPSDRMTNVEILAFPGRDVVRFSFGERSLEPKGPATGTLDVATPPYAGGAGGAPIDLRGEHAVQVVFKGMSLQNDVGQLAYDGPREFQVTDPTRSLRHVVLFDESEGQLGWYLGYDGRSCVTLTRAGDTIDVALVFGPGG